METTLAERKERRKQIRKAWDKIQSAAVIIDSNSDGFVQVLVTCGNGIEDVSMCSADKIIRFSNIE